MSESQPQPPPSPFDLSGGAVCLDFINTLGDRPVRAQEKLHDPSDLLRWAEAVGILEKKAIRELQDRIRRDPDAAAAALRAAIELRETLYEIFSALAAGRPADPVGLAALNAALAEALPHLRLELGEQGCCWTWAPPPDRLRGLLWPVVRSAAELLTGPEASLVRECASDRCSWLFVDRSRTHRRRWCDMKVCGNRAKARRHYQRRKKNS